MRHNTDSDSIATISFEEIDDIVPGVLVRLKAPKNSYMSRDWIACKDTKVIIDTSEPIVYLALETPGNPSTVRDVMLKSLHRGNIRFIHIARFHYSLCKWAELSEAKQKSMFHNELMKKIEIIRL